MTLFLSCLQTLLESTLALTVSLGIFIFHVFLAALFGNALMLFNVGRSSVLLITNTAVILFAELNAPFPIVATFPRNISPANGHPLNAFVPNSIELPAGYVKLSVVSAVHALNAA